MIWFNWLGPLLLNLLNQPVITYGLIRFQPLTQPDGYCLITDTKYINISNRRNVFFTKELTQPLFLNQPQGMFDVG